jgi:hypothetical protein
VALCDIVVLQVPDRYKHRRAWRGLWRCYDRIPPTQIPLAGTGTDWAASPLES